MNTLAEWLQSQKSDLDRLIAAGSESAFDANPDWSAFELDQTMSDIWNLHQNADCCYDRPSIGPTYALWYHGRRLHDTIRLLHQYWVGEDKQDAWSLIDLGCGTGATVWALGLIAVGLHQTGRRHPLQIECFAIDSSPFMLDFAERLWSSHFLRQYPEARHLIRVEFRCETWVRAACSCRERPRIVAGYLFDHSDHERVPEIADSLVAVAKRHEAGRLLLLGARQKESLLRQAVAQFDTQHWDRREALDFNSPIWSGNLDVTCQVRHTIYGERLQNQSFRWQRPPVWSGSECVATELISTLPKQLGLFGPPEVPKIILDDAQQKATEPSDRPAIIVGAAGSGKSIVLAQRIARTLLNPPTSGPVRMLVTAFNKRMIDQLAEWVQEHLPDDSWRLVPQTQSPSSANPDDVSCGWWELEYPGSASRQLTLMNWDLAMTRLFHVKGVRVSVRDELDHDIQEAIQKARRKHGLTEHEHDDILNPGFIVAEKHRVVFGLGAITLRDYLDVQRTGRGRPLQRVQRQIVADVMSELQTMMIQRRIEALRRVRGLPGRYRADDQPPRFDFIFVDECQDFTPADFELLHFLNDGRNQIVAAGDLTQAMRLGPSFRVPTLPSKQRWAHHRLKGSYRLPLRVCESVHPLACAISDKHRPDEEESFALPESRKAAVLGVRPILVVGDDVPSQAQQVNDIWKEYADSLDIKRVTIAEEDDELHKQLLALMGQRVRIENQSMNRIKGLERPFVVWSTRIPVDADESEEEWAFTIMTRTTSILVIVVGHDTTPAFEQVVRSLRRDRLMPWTQEAQQWLAFPA